jgi:glycogen operon protein
MAQAYFRVEAGSDAPLGATWDGSGTNFALFSAHASKVELCLFNETGLREIARIPLPEYTHQVWHGYLPGVRPGQLYGYRVHGPYEPHAGHRFNPNKLLLDPYARAHLGPLRWHDSLFGYRVGHRNGDLSFDRRDSARSMPKCVVVDAAYTWGDDRNPRTPWNETFVYEAHVGGMTRGYGGIEEPLRGTFEGMADEKVIARLKERGVTAVELLPIHAFHDDRMLVEKGLVNWWGYNTLGFFAPASRYLARDGDVEGFKLLVRRLHDAGLEVLLDVVYNHTAEGNQMGPTLSFRGIDNASYYVLGDDPRYTFDTTGTGNSLNMRNRRVLQMVMDSLRYWVEECHVDGFRFDLASTLGRDRDEFDPHAPFLEAVAQDPALAQVKMIAEPWDTGPNGYQVGNYPPGWAEWNDKYRDTVRAFWRGDPGQARELGDRLLGSASLYDHDGRRPWASVNFVTAHDGFTLADLVAYDDKHNEANGEDNRDGHSHNLSWNHGVEGPTEDPQIRALRDRQRRNLFATMLLSQGTPMMLMGDERGRSQGGNNNAYCQEGPINWLDWENRSDPFERFCRGMADIRGTRPLLSYTRFLHAHDDNPERRCVMWQRPEGGGMEPGDWEDPNRRALALVMQGAADRPLLLALNAGAEARRLLLPHGRWVRLVDTGRGLADPQGTAAPETGEVPLEARTLLLFEGAGVFQPFEPARG